MKRKFLLLTAVLACLMLFGCSGGASADDVDIYICEEYFVRTVHGITNNFANYVGQTVKIEGVFQITGTDIIYRAVLRQDQSC